MGSTSDSAEISIDAFPYLRVYTDGRVERLAGTQIAPAGLDLETGVVSKDVVLDQKSGVSARLYRPIGAEVSEKLPLAVYFHGGAFFISSTADPIYHQSLSRLAAEANALIVSIDYRLAPENPLPTAFDDCWSALTWLGSGATAEPWLDEGADLTRVVLVGDSAGANIAHHMLCRVSGSESKPGFRVSGAVLVHPYFWGGVRVGSEVDDLVRSSMVDRWWRVVCPSERGNDDPLINPFVDGAPGLDGLNCCDRILVVLAENDILRDRGLLYYDTVLKSPLWNGKIEVVETKGEDHIFHVLRPDTDNAKKLVKLLADFIAS